MLREVYSFLEKHRNPSKENQTKQQESVKGTFFRTILNKTQLSPSSSGQCTYIVYVDYIYILPWSGSRRKRLSSRRRPDSPIKHRFSAFPLFCVFSHWFVSLLKVSPIIPPHHVNSHSKLTGFHLAIFDQLLYDIY